MDLRLIVPESVTGSAVLLAMAALLGGWLLSHFARRSVLALTRRAPTVSPAVANFTSRFVAYSIPIFAVGVALALLGAKVPHTLGGVESVLWYVLPLGIATTLSVLPLLAAVLILQRPNAAPSGIGYLARARRAPAVTAVWARSLERIRPGRAAAVGVAMNARPKNVALALGAGLAIGSAPLDLPEVSIAILVFTVLGGSTVSAVVASYLASRDRVRPVFGRLATWLLTRAPGVLHATLAVIGVLIVCIGGINLALA